MVVHSSSGCRHARNGLGPIFGTRSIEMALRDRAPSAANHFTAPLTIPPSPDSSPLSSRPTHHPDLLYIASHFLLFFVFCSHLPSSSRLCPRIIARHLPMLRPLTRRGDRCCAFQFTVTSAILLPARQYPRSSRRVSFQRFRFRYLPVSYPDTQPSMLQRTGGN